MRVSWGNRHADLRFPCSLHPTSSEVMRSEPAGSRGGRPDRSDQELGSRAVFGRDLIHVPISWPSGLDGRASVPRLHHHTRASQLAGKPGEEGSSPGSPTSVALTNGTLQGLAELARSLSWIGGQAPWWRSASAQVQFTLRGDARLPRKA